MYEKDALFFLYTRNEGEAVYYVTHQGGAHYGSKELPDFSKALSMSPDEQLKVAGFNLIGNGLYRIQLKDRVIIVYLNDGRIINLFTSGKIEPLKFDGETKITGLGSIKKWSSEPPLQTLVIENRFLRGEISSFGYLEKIELKVDGIQIPEAVITVRAKPGSSNDTFNRGGVNRTEAISNSSVVNGNSLASISHRLSHDVSCNSDETFLRRGQSLVPMLKSDNDKVLQNLNLTHQKNAHPLLLGKIIATIARKGFGSFTYNGRTFRVEVQDFLCGSVSSPFGDGLSMSKGARVSYKDEKSGDLLIMSKLTPEYIYLYGYYGSTRGALDPAAIARFFGL